MLGIPFYVWDFSERFKADVVDDFVAEYAAGRTPNPCMRCNERIKFAALLEKALALGFDAVCTGHYATVITDADGNRELHRARRPGPRTSPTCSACSTREQLAHAMFPLGDTPSKAEVRAEAAAPRARGGRTSPTATTSASSPTATPPAGSPSGSARRPGDIVDAHRRRASASTPARTRSPSASAAACGSAAPAAGRQAALRAGRSGPVTNTVTVGPREALDVDRSRPPRDRSARRPGRRSAVQVRAHGDECPGRSSAAGDTVRLRLAGRCAAALRPDGRAYAGTGRGPAVARGAAVRPYRRRSGSPAAVITAGRRGRDA